MAGPDKLAIYQMAARHLADARFNVITDDSESRYALDDAWPRATNFVLRQGAWRFALKTVALAVGGTPAAGFATGYARPADWLRTHAIFAQTTDGREHPIDLREQGVVFSVNIATPPVLRYLSTSYLDPTFADWPEHFAQVVAAYLAFLVAERVTGERTAPGRMSQLFSSLLPEALAIDAVPETDWLPFQRDGRMLRSARELLEAVDWRFALKTAAAVAGGSPVAGYANCFVHPADRLRTSALYIASAGREFPFDVREHDTHWSTNVAAFSVRYLSTAGLDSTLWPDPFSKTLLARLIAEEAGETGAGDGKGGAKDNWAAYQAMLAEAARSHAIAPNPWLAAQLDGTFERVARAMIDEAFWRFSLKTVLVNTPSGTGEGGRSHSYTIPADWSRTRALWRPTPDGARRPFDVREAAGRWHTNEASFYAQYVSSTLAMDSTQWPDHYERAVLRGIEFDGVDSGDDQHKTSGAVWKDALADTLDSEADPPDPWLPHQLNGRFERAAAAIISRGYWKFALTTVNLDQSQQLAAAAEAEFPFRYALPTDWLRTHSIFVPWDGAECPVNVRETTADWSTDAPAFTARYVSRCALDATTWPDTVNDAALAFLEWQDEAAGSKDAAAPKAAAFDRLMADALDIYSRPEDQWLRYQLDGSFVQGVKLVLEKGRWRFATKSPSIAASSDPNAFSDGTVSQGYGYRIPKPADCLRVITVYRILDSGIGANWIEIDYRDEGDAIHANYSPLVVRYISRLGLDATQWSTNFRDAVLAWLQHCEARANPKMAGLAKERLDFFRMQCREAERSDDARDRPPVRDTGRIVRGRLGGRYSSASLEQGFWPS